MGRYKEERKQKNAFGNWCCKSCQFIGRTRRELQKHHKDEHCFSKSHPWNKGLTKETDPRVRKYGETISTKIKAGEIPKAFEGKHHTEEWCKRHSEQMKERFKGISIFATARENRKSYPEEYFEKIFSTAERNYHVDRYFLDFAYPDKKFYVEVDGEQHYIEDGVKHDKLRTEILESLGWICIERIRWKEYIKLNSEERILYVNSILTRCEIGSQEIS